MDALDRKPLILICGPTGVGKSSISVKLAKEIGGEIISADSVQVYKGLDIGSAKITKEEMAGVPHYLIDVLNPDENFGVDIFQKLAKEAITAIYENNHIPIVCGGTAFYIQALLYDIDFTEEGNTDHSYRDSLLKLGKTEEGSIDLWEKLKAIDSEYAAITHYNNVKRVVRALEYYHNTGKRFSDYNREQANRESPYNYIYFALTDERNRLYERINNRVDKMVEDGLLKEVEDLLRQGYTRDLNSLSSIGYNEICSYIYNDCSYEEALENIKKNSRHYAKRQLTWLRRERNVNFIDRNLFENDEDILCNMKNIIKERLNVL